MSITILASDGSGGPPTVRDIDGSANEFVYTNSRLAFSGNYTTAVGGDTLDLTPLVQAGVPSNLTPINAYVEGNGLSTSQSAGGGYYQIGLGTNLTNNKVKIFSAGGAELGSGAYPAAVTSDVVNLIIVWRKFQ